ncbi:hypothetical protein K7X08_025704 [Anisodus acutangulus]|uniref:Uncharacterized protein n=1 Tax=Anisodus acutangulus TaxID=402998 RepID=A0A9Q1LB33_9SOLA|nr:hypothetical protein K7X08_025704 [Anisodus acutangulus]
MFLCLISSLPEKENSILMEIDHIGYVRQAFEAGSLSSFLEIIENGILRDFDVPIAGFRSVLWTFISTFIASYEINLQLEDGNLKLILDILCKIYQGEVAAGLFAVSVMCKVKGGARGSLSVSLVDKVTNLWQKLRKLPAFSELMMICFERGYSGGNELDDLILNDLFYHLQGELEAQAELLFRFTRSPSTHLSISTCLMILKTSGYGLKVLSNCRPLVTGVISSMKIFLMLILFSLKSSWRDSRLGVQTEIEHNEALPEAANKHFPMQHIVLKLQDKSSYSNIDIILKFLLTIAHVKEGAEMLLNAGFSASLSVLLADLSNGGPLAPDFPSDNHDKKRLRALKPHTSLSALRESENTVMLICVLAKHRNSWSRAMKEMESQLRERCIHLLAFISCGTPCHGESPGRVPPIICHPTLREEYEWHKKPSSINSKNGWFAFSALRCGLNPKYSSFSSRTAIVIKDQPNEHVNLSSQTHFTDAMSIQIYRITFLLLKFVSTS